MKALSISYQYYFNELDRKPDPNNVLKWSNVAMEWDSLSNVKDFIKMNPLNKREVRLYTYTIPNNENEEVFNNPLYSK